MKPGMSDALMSQMDFLATFAALTGQKVKEGEARDSENHLEALLGAKKAGREYLVERSNGGAPFGFRHGTWKYTPNDGPKAKKADPALYDRAADRPDVAKRLTGAALKWRKGLP